MANINDQILRQIPANQPFVPRMGMAKGDLSFFSKIDVNSKKYEEKVKLFGSDFVFIHATREAEPAVLEFEDFDKSSFLPKFSHEADLLFLDEELRVQGEFVFFPSMWEPEPKFGKLVEEAHSLVPGLNTNLGKTIRTFLERLPADSKTVFLRTNLGVTQTDELNQHPNRKLPPLTDVDNCYVRVEEQGFLKLAMSRYTVFGIKVYSVPLHDFCSHEEAARGLFIALDTMPDDMAEYKGLLKSKVKLLEKIRKYF